MSSAEAAHVLGLIRFQQQRFAEAGELFGVAARLGPSAAVLSDLGCARLSLGQAEGAVAALEGAVALDPGHAPAWTLLGHAFQSRGEEARAAEFYGRAAALLPGDAEAHARRAAALSAAGDTAGAVLAYRAAVAIDPRFAEALNNLGVLLDGDDALACFDAAIAARPGLADAHYNRANLLMGQDRVEAAIAGFRAALAADPGRTDAALNLGGALMRANRPAEAAVWFSHVPTAHARFSEALATLVRGNLREGFRRYEARLAIPSVSPARHIDLPRWHGDDVKGRAVLVYEEQGIGDTVQCLRYVPLLADRGARVVLDVRITMVELARSLRGVAEVVWHGAARPACDAAVPVMSLPLAFGTDLASIPASVPYLAAAPYRVEGWAARLPPAGGRRRVGIAWSGSASFGNDRQRSMPLEALMPLLAREDCAFHVLQTEVREADAAVLAALPGVANPAAEFVDLSDTAAVIALMDAVVSVDTSIAHLAGALARPVWVMLPYAPDWRWMLDRVDSPWYPTARLVRQSAPGDWAGVVARVEAGL